MNSTANPSTAGFSRQSGVTPIDGSLMEGQMAFDDLVAPMATLSLYGSALSRTSSAPAPAPDAAAPAASSPTSSVVRADSPVRASAPCVRISNIPADTSLREAYLVFSLCIDEITYVNIVRESGANDAQRSADGSHDGAAPVILAYFASDKTAQQVAQLLDSRRLFGSSHGAVAVDYLDGTHARSVQQRTQVQHAPHAQSAPQAHQRTQQSQFLQGPPVPQKAMLSGKSRMLFGGLDPAPAASAPTSASSSSGSSSGRSSAPNLFLHQPQLAQRPEPSQSFSAQSVLSSLTSPIVTSSGRNVLMLDQYDHMMHPWASGNTPVGSPVSASASQTPLSVNTSLAGAGALSASSTPLSATFGAAEWDRRAHPFLSADHRTSQSKGLSLGQGMGALGADLLSMPGAQPQSRAAQMPHLTSPARLDAQQRQRQQAKRQLQVQIPPAQGQQAQQAQQAEQVQQVQQAQQAQQEQDVLGSSPQLSMAERGAPKQLPPAQTALEQQQQQQLIPELSLLSRIPPPTNPADQNPPCNTLYVGNLPPDATELELRELFQPQKGFKRLSFKNKQSNGNSHHGPMCFVEFEDVAHATRALAELYGRTLPRSGSNAKGGIRLSFSKNPLGVRGPGSSRRASAPNQYRGGAGAGGYSNYSGGNYGQYTYARGK